MTNITSTKPPHIPGILEILDADAGTYRPSPSIAPVVTKAVFRRDMGYCHFCGENAGRYHQVVGYGGIDRDIDNLVTSCFYCWQCFDLESVRKRRSAILVYCPEIAQAQLNRTGLQVHSLAISGGLHSEMSEAMYIALRERAHRASSGLGRSDLLSQPIETILQTLRQSAATDPEFVFGLRLWPIDRWIDKRGELEFNRHPEMVAYWRSKQSGIGSPRYILEDPDSPFLHALRLLAPEMALRYDESKHDTPSKATTHYELASKLLRDAAIFFNNIGNQNAPLARQMTENSGVFKQIADLIEERPSSHVGDDPEKPTHAALAAKLLRDAAAFFETIAMQNPPLRLQMAENADVFRQVANLVEKAPEDVIQS